MAIPVPSRELAQERIAAVEHELRSGGTISSAAAKIGIPRQTLWEHVRPNGTFERVHGLKANVSREQRAKADAADLTEKISAARGEMGFEPVLPGYEIKETSVQLDRDGTVEKTWVRQARERGDVFDVPSGQRIKGISALVDENGRTIAKWIKTREDDATADLVQALTEVFDEYRGASPVAAPPIMPPDPDTLTVYPIADLHVGMYSWAPETGDDFDLKIVEDTFIAKLGTLVAKASPSKTAVFLNLGDFFHSDSRANRTEHSGAALDVDSRYARVLQIGVRLMIRGIEIALTKHETVIVRCLPGNHDYHASLALTIALGSFFHGNPRVVVDSDPSKFFVYQFGKTLIAATHGDMAKPAQMPGIVAARWPELWGFTSHRYCLTGHIHHRSMLASELNGMICETFQTLAAKDFWHASMGYCAGRSLVAITYDREHGECDRVTAAIPAPRDLRGRKLPDGWGSASFFQEAA